MTGVKMLGNRKLELREFPEPMTEGDWVLVEVKACALCGNDLHDFYRPSLEDAYNNNRNIPVHEISGVVGDLDEAQHLKKGDRVLVYPYVGCNNVLPCDNALWRDCQDWKIIGLDLHGGQAEFLIFPERNLFRISDDITDFAAALVWDGIGSAYGALKRLRVDEQDLVAVFGFGPIRLGAANNCTYKGDSVIAIDPVDFMLRLAENLGAEYTINPSTRSVEDALRDLSGGLGSDVCLEHMREGWMLKGF